MLAAVRPAWGDDPRSNARTTIFLPATLLTGGAKPQPVKIVNLSPGGAMIEAAVLPPRRTAVKLVSAQFSIVGRVAWEAGNRAGLEFDSPLSLKQVIASPAASGPPPLAPVVAPLPAEAPSAASEPLPPEERLPPSSNKSTNELDVAAELLRQFGAALARDEGVLSRHGVALQKIDIAVQLLEALAAGAGDGIAVDPRLAALSASAREALRSED
jgi:hypothetical protein